MGMKAKNEKRKRGKTSESFFINSHEKITYNKKGLIQEKIDRRETKGKGGDKSIS